METITIQKKHRKTLSMRIKADGQILVSAPWWYDDKKINQRIASKKVWIEKTLHRLSQTQSPSLAENQYLLFSEVYTIELAPKQPPIDTVTKTIYIPPWVPKEERLRSVATTYLKKKMAYRQTVHHCSYDKLFIRSQTTKRWTCSSKKHISLNRKLITLPERVIDYVICHELAHLTHMNHSKQFWDHCQKLYPRALEAKKWLRKNAYGIK